MTGRNNSRSFYFCCCDYWKRWAEVL